MSSAFVFGEYSISAEMVDCIRDYVELGRPPGSFLTAVICNDLTQACRRADEVNLRNLPAFVAYFYNDVPGPCWGSRERMDAWMAQHIAAGIRTALRRLGYAR